MKNISALHQPQINRNLKKSCSFKIKLADSLLLLLIFIFFAIPITGLSWHYYKFGLPSRLQGIISFIFYSIKEIFNWL